MYQALYRKWRPRTFDDVVGQEHITETLKRQIVLDRLSHAYLFTGTRGTGKTTCAKIFAKSVNCEHPSGGNPCNSCPSCLGIDSGSILDVVELDAASNNGVENVRTIRDEAIYTPASVRKRVYIIDEVHMLSNSAFNALLKILEEPPEHLIFILATTELYKVPATILSRCQRHSFKRIPPAQIAGRLKYVASMEQIDLTEDAADLLSRLADGSMRDALSLLDQCSSGGTVDSDRVLSAIGLAGNMEIARLLSSISSGDADSALSILNNLYLNGKDVLSVLEELSTLERDILLCQIAPQNGSGLLSGGYDRSSLLSFASSIPSEKLLSDIDELQQSISDIGRGGSRKTIAELCLIKLCGISFSVSAPSVSPLQSSVSVSSGDNESCALPDKAPEERSADVSSIPDENSGPAPRSSADSERPMPDASMLLTSLERVLDPMIYVLLSDKTQAELSITGSQITVTAKNAFVPTQLDVPSVKSDIEKCAQTLFQQNFSVSVTLENSRPSGSSKLDSLSKFQNIKFQ